MGRRVSFAACCPAPPLRSSQSPWRRGRPCRTVHPRVHGADLMATRSDFARAGSSPRARSRRPPRRTPAVRYRLIPACAEQTSNRPHARTPAAAHPRVCGADHTPAHAPPSKSPAHPRVCGAVNRLSVEGVLIERLIPACAEQTTSSTNACCARSAHPRVCGADFQPPPRKDTCCGSSPRVRSRLFSRVPRMVGARLIPACAEQTLVGVVVS